MRYTAKEAVATICGMDFAEMNDARYQPTMWSMPVWDFGAKPYSARKVGSKKTPVNNHTDHLTGGLYNWEPVGVWKDWEVLEGQTIGDYDDENDAAFNMRGA
jgi:hypothetical protein